jgi:hypothetical protein
LVEAEFHFQFLVARKFIQAVDFTDFLAKNDEKE